MASVKKLMAAGLSSLSANSAAGQISPELTATGTTQDTALLLNSDINFIGTVTINGGCVINPDYESCVVINGGGATFSLYPPVGGSINGGATNAPISVAAGATLVVIRARADSLSYATLLGA